jgi:hypothetical protein
MKLGFVSAILPDRSLEQVLRIAAATSCSPLPQSSTLAE